MGELGRGGRLGLLHVGQDRGGRPDSLHSPPQAETVQAGDPEMALQELLGCVGRHLPGLHRRDLHVQGRDQWLESAPLQGPVGQDQLAGPEAAQLLPHPPLRLLGAAAPDLGGRELPGGDVAVGHARLAARPVEGDGHQVVVPLLVQQGRLGDRPLGHHPLHRPLHQPLARLADLLRDGHLIARLHQPSDVPLRSVVGDPGQGHPLAVAHRTAGQGHVTDPGHQLGVLVEGLVEVAQPEKEDAVRILFLQRQVLATHGCGHGRLLVVGCSWCSGSQVAGVGHRPAGAASP